jgi:hypothetical protein
LKEKPKPMFLKLPYEIERERIPPNLFYEARITWITRSDQGTTKKKIIDQFLC